VSGPTEHAAGCPVRARNVPGAPPQERRHTGDPADHQQAPAWRSGCERERGQGDARGRRPPDGVETAMGGRSGDSAGARFAPRHVSARPRRRTAAGRSRPSPAGSVGDRGRPRPTDSARARTSRRQDGEHGAAARRVAAAMRRRRPPGWRRRRAPGRPGDDEDRHTRGGARRRRGDGEEADPETEGRARPRRSAARRRRRSRPGCRGEGAEQPPYRRVSPRSRPTEGARSRRTGSRPRPASRSDQADGDPPASADHTPSITTTEVSVDPSDPTFSADTSRPSGAGRAIGPRRPCGLGGELVEPAFSGSSSGCRRQPGCRPAARAGWRRMMAAVIAGCGQHPRTAIVVIEMPASGPSGRMASTCRTRGRASSGPGRWTRLCLCLGG